MHDTLQPGMRLNAFYPIGRFHLDAIPDMPLAFVSAGSGASPLMSMLRTLALYQPLADVAWVHSARDAHDILFAVELTALQRRMPNLRVMVTLSRPSPGWFGLCGRFTRRLIGAVVPDFSERDVYCCGPVGFMDEMRRIHAAEGARRAAFHVEHFAAPLPVLEPLPASGLGSLTNGPAGVSDTGFQARLGRKTFTIAPGETILMAAARQQVVIPCGCASGMCGTCKLKCVSGDVVMRHQGGLSDVDEANGFILACSSRPASDLDLEF
jgi:ferredoxin-NADP reductase